MDSEHRHELKENDLAEFLAHFGQWWSKHGNIMLTVILVGVVGFTAKRWINAHAIETKQKAWRDLADTTSPDGYRAVAVSYRDPAVRALAYLRGADQLLANATVPQDDQPDEQTTSNSNTNHTNPVQDLDSAASMYQQIVRDDQAHLVYKLNAQLGLAAIAESRKNWDQARQHYNAIINQPDAQYAAIAQRARTRAALLDRLQKPVVFGPNSTTKRQVPQGEDSTSKPLIPSDQGDPDTP